jgi:hypothetical protein
VSSARDLLAALLLIAALLLAALWLPGVWLDRHVVDRDGFLAITQPLADDAKTQQELSDAAVETILEDDRIPGWVAQRATPLLQDQAPRLTGTEVYGELWGATMIELHSALFTAGPQPLEVDLLPVIDALLEEVEGAIPWEIPRPGQASFTLATIPDLPLLLRVQSLAPWAHWAGPLAGILALLAVLLSAHRRSMLALAGVAGILAGALTCLLAGQIATLVPDALDRADFLGPIVTTFEAHFTAVVMPQGVIMLGAGALVAATGLVLIGLHRPR